MAEGAIPFDPSVINCSICIIHVHNTARVKCCQCTAVLCVQCFRMGAEGGAHKRGHSYEVVDPAGKQLFDQSWSVCDEYELLKNVIKFKMGNWREVTDLIDTKRSVEDVKKYFSRYFVTSTIGKAAMAEGHWRQIRKRWMDEGVLHIDNDDDSIFYLLALEALRAAPSDAIPSVTDENHTAKLTALVDDHVTEQTLAALKRIMDERNADGASASTSKGGSVRTCDVPINPIGYDWYADLSEKSKSKETKKKRCMRNAQRVKLMRQIHTQDLLYRMGTQGTTPHEEPPSIAVQKRVDRYDVLKTGVIHYNNISKEKFAEYENYLEAEMDSTTEEDSEEEAVKTVRKMKKVKRRFVNGQGEVIEDDVEVEAHNSDATVDLSDEHEEEEEEAKGDVMDVERSNGDGISDELNDDDEREESHRLNGDPFEDKEESPERRNGDYGRANISEDEYDDRGPHAVDAHIEESVDEDSDGEHDEEKNDKSPSLPHLLSPPAPPERKRTPVKLKDDETTFLEHALELLDDEDYVIETDSGEDDEDATVITYIPPKVENKHSTLAWEFKRRDKDSTVVRYQPVFVIRKGEKGDNDIRVELKLKPLRKEDITTKEREKVEKNEREEEEKECKVIEYEKEAEDGCGPPKLKKLKLRLKKSPRRRRVNSKGEECEEPSTSNGCQRDEEWEAMVVDEEEERAQNERDRRTIREQRENTPESVDMEVKTGRRRSRKDGCKRKEGQEKSTETPGRRRKKEDGNGRRRTKEVVKEEVEETDEEDEVDEVEERGGRSTRKAKVQAMQKIEKKERRSEVEEGVETRRTTRARDDRNEMESRERRERMRRRKEVKKEKKSEERRKRDEEEEDDAEDEPIPKERTRKERKISETVKRTEKKKRRKVSDALKSVAPSPIKRKRRRKMATSKRERKMKYIAKRMRKAERQQGKSQNRPSSRALLNFPPIHKLKTLDRIMCRKLAPRRVFDCEDVGYFYRPNLKQYAHEMALIGYNPLRDEFEMDYYNNAEQLISRLNIIHQEFTPAVQIENEIKLMKVQRYFRVLRMRRMYRNMIMHHNLMPDFFKLCQTMEGSPRKKYKEANRKPSIEKQMRVIINKTRAMRMDDIAAEDESQQQWLEEVLQARENASDTDEQFEKHTPTYIREWQKYWRYLHIDESDREGGDNEEDETPLQQRRRRQRTRAQEAYGILGDRLLAANVARFERRAPSELVARITLDELPLTRDALAHFDM